jgi:hypothetical protein
VCTSVGGCGIHVHMHVCVNICVSGQCVLLVRYLGLFTKLIFSPTLSMSRSLLLFSPNPLTLASVSGDLQTWQIDGAQKRLHTILDGTGVRHICMPTCNGNKTSLTPPGLPSGSLEWPYHSSHQAPQHLHSCPTAPQVNKPLKCLWCPKLHENWSK